MFFDAVMSVAMMLLMILVGCFVRWKELLRSESTRDLSALVTKVGVPALIFNNLLTSYSRDELLRSIPAIGVALAVQLFLYIFAIFMARALRIPKGRRGVFCASMTFTNSLFIGLPVCVAVFGESSVPPTLLFYFVNTLLLWTLGVYGISRDVQQSAKLTVKGLTRLLQPPIVSLLISTLLLALDVSVPSLLLDTAGKLGAFVTPMAMLLIGGTLYDMFRGGFRWERGYSMLLIGRAILAPSLMLLAARVFALPPQVADVFVMQSGMPVQTQVYLCTKSAGADEQYASGILIITTILSVLFIPLYAAILRVI